MKPRRWAATAVAACGAMLVLTVTVAAADFDETNQASAPADVPGVPPPAQRLHPRGRRNANARTPLRRYAMVGTRRHRKGRVRPGRLSADPAQRRNNAYGAVVHLCGTAARDFADRDQLAEALYRYNHVRAYVRNVLRWIDHYDTYVAVDSAEPPSDSGKGAKILTAATRWRGTPYSWGGGNTNGPSYGGCCNPGGQDGSTIKGFDCSGLTLYALAQIGVHGLQHSATWQYRNAERLGARRIPRSKGIAALQPGDLIWFSTTPANPTYTHHVGIYAGNQRMINAPRPGKPVRIDPINLNEYAGAVRW